LCSFDGIEGIQLATAQDAHDRIKRAIANRQPLAVQRLGAVEARILMWSLGLKIPGRFGLKYPVFFWETFSGTTNAGIRPRNRASYRQYAQFCSTALGQSDVLGVWRTGYEEAVYRTLQPRAVACHGETLGPTFRLRDHWLHHLGGRRLLVFSPFAESIRAQLPHMDQIWAPINLRWSSTVEVVKFPYLIDDSCLLDWRDVYASCSERLHRDDYDVAIFGCGGLGIPLAQVAKTTGRIGMHLGGLTQLIFGIYGARHLDHFWHRECINEFWKRPEPEERAQTYKRVEGGCYW
jgi:hypothetical protein